MRELSVRELRQVVGGDLMDDFDGFGGGVMVGGGAVDYMVDPDGAIEIFAPGTSPDPSDPSITDLPPVVITPPSSTEEPNSDGLLPQIAQVGGIALGVGLALARGGVVIAVIDLTGVGIAATSAFTLATYMTRHPNTDDNRVAASKYADAFGVYNTYKYQ